MQEKQKNSCLMAAIFYKKIYFFKKY